MSGGLLKLVRQILFFSDSSFEAAMDGCMEGVLWWWSKFYVKFFFESFVVKGVCFFC